MAVNGKQKGKSGELEFCHFLRDTFGVSARRGQQFSGGSDSPDVIHDIAGIHFEVKRTERLKLYDAVDQAMADCAGSIPVVAHRRNRGDWLCILRCEDIHLFAKQIVARLGS